MQGFWKMVETGTAAKSFKNTAQENSA